MSVEVERSIKKMKKVFEKIVRNRISTGDPSKGETKYIASGSVDGYTKQMASMLRTANKRFGITRFEDFSPDIFEYLIEDLINKFKATGEGASSINTKISAIKAFCIGVDQSNVYRTTKNRADSHLLDFHKDYIKGLRKKIKGDKVFRSGPNSTVLRATEEQALKVIENIQKDGYATVSRRQTADLAFLSLRTGGRVSSCLRMKAKDLDFDNKTITMVNAKGGLTYYVDMRDEDIPLLKSIVGDLKPNQSLFEFRNKDGRIKSTEEARKLVHKYVKGAGAEFAFENKRFSTHSFRKAFARTTMEDYIDKIKTKADIETEVARLSKRDPKVAVKYDRLYKRFNQYRIDKKLPLKDVSTKEAIVFFTSIQMGHFRNDVVSSYYSTYDEAVKSKKGELAIS